MKALHSSLHIRSQKNAKFIADARVFNHCLIG